MYKAEYLQNFDRLTLYYFTFFASVMLGNFYVENKYILKVLVDL